ncbi:MAG: molecular chaperone DnaK, partial [Acidobacteriota bacterium]
KAVQEGDVGHIQAAVEKLTSSAHKLAEVMYQSATPGDQAGAPPQAQAPPSSEEKPNGEAQGKPDGEVIDAEYVDVDEKKKPN